MSHIINTAEVGFGNFKLISEVLADFGRSVDLTREQQERLAVDIAAVLDVLTEDNHICFDSNSFVEEATA